MDNFVYVNPARGHSGELKLRAGYAVLTGQLPTYGELYQKEVLLVSPDQGLSEKIELILANQERIISLLSSKLSESEATDDVLVFEEISRDEAKERIINYFEESGEELHYDDIMRDLRIDLDTVVGICEELKEEGKIEVG